jgi:hypothetical protein
MVQYIQALVLRMVRLCKLVSSWLVNFIHIFQNAGTLYRNLFAQLKLSIEHYLARSIIQVQLMKAGLINVLIKVGALGQQLLTTARQILQRVYQALRRGR